MSFFGELRRRNVYKVGIAYLIAAWLIVQIVSAIAEPLGLPDWFDAAIIVLLAVGFPVALLLGWAYELTPAGIKRTSNAPLDEVSVHSTGRRLNFLVIGLFIGAVLTTTTFRLLGTGERAALASLQGIRELEVVIAAGEWEAAFQQANALAENAPESQDLAELWPSFSLRNAINTDPPGARVYRSAYGAADDEWEDLGVTPLADVRLPFGLSRLRFELDGYSTLLRTTRQGGVEMLGATTNTQRITQLPVFILDTEESLPEGQIRIPGWTANIGRESVQFADYFLDRNEVTNREFKRFVDAGGYNRREFWSEPIFVDGAALSFEESRALFVDRTTRPGPSTWEAGDYPNSADDFPVSGVSWFEAAAYAKFMNAELPTYAHWTHATNPLADAWTLPTGNLSSDGSALVGSHGNLSQYGNYDMMGNVREWAYNATQDQTRRYTLGGSWIDRMDIARIPAPANPLDRSEINGFRLARTFDLPHVREAARNDSPSPQTWPNVSELMPLSNELFAAYARIASYDPLPLNPAIDDTSQDRNWSRERIIIDTAYGAQMAIYLFIPNNVQPPYQTIIYFPNVWFGGERTIDSSPFHVDFIVNSGRAVAFPMLVGGYERPDAIGAGEGRWHTNVGRDRLIQVNQDIRRTLDYLTTRNDIDQESIGFYGLSLGGMLAPQQLALEPRIQTAVLTVTGLLSAQSEFMPEVDPASFLPRIEIPVLMINGELDPLVPRTESAEPFFQLLGTPPEDKRLITAPGGHFVPRNILVPEALDWFDEHLGPVGS